MRLLTSQLFLVFFAVCWTAASVALSLRTGQWHWFSRSGAITVIMGASLTVRRLLRLGVQGFVIAERTFNGGHALPTPDEVEAHRQVRLRCFQYASRGHPACSWNHNLGIR